MADTTDSDLFKDIPIGELNELGFDPEDPLITNSYDGKSLFEGMFNKFMSREPLFDSRTPKKAIVLLSTSILTSGLNPRLFHGAEAVSKMLSAAGLLGNTRNFAIIRIPEIHAHIPLPSMQILSELSEDGTDPGELPERDKLLLSMHDAAFSSPINIGDMPALNAGDIVLVDGDGTIIQLVEPSEIGFFGRMKEAGYRALDWATQGMGLSGKRPPTEITPWGLPHGSENTNWSGIVIHYSGTSGARPPGEEHPYGRESGSADESNAVDILRRRSHGGDYVSYHWVVDKSGRAVELIKDDHVAYHASGQNRTHIGISLVNLGYQSSYADNRSDLSTSGWLSSGGKLWEPFPRAQYQGLVRLIKDLQARYPSIETITSHEDHDDGKPDPGPAFDEYWDQLVGDTALVRESPLSTRNRD